METTNRNTILLKSKHICFSFNVGYLILLITFIHSIIFNSNASQISMWPEIFVSYSNIFFTIFQITSPAIIGYYLYNRHKKEQINVKITYSSIILYLLLMIYLIINYVNTFNLYSDEIAYARNSFKLSLGLLIKLSDLVPKLDMISANHLLQIVTLIQWVLVFMSFYYFYMSKNKYKT